MKNINPLLFEELCKTSNNIVTGWTLTRQDGVVMGFTSHDVSFVYNGITYNPANAFSASAAVSKADFSLDNMEADVLFTSGIDEQDVRNGVYDYASVQMFWINPYNPQWGSIPIRGGNLGVITMEQGHFKAELRSFQEQLQLPFGEIFTLECNAKLGDSQCKVVTSAGAWAPNTQYFTNWGGGSSQDAAYVSVVRPSTYNGFWYRAIAGTTTQTIPKPSGESYAGNIWVGNAFLYTLMYGQDPPIWVVVWAMQLQQAWLANPPQGSITTDNVTLSSGNSGATEPAWPTTLGATIVDGGVTWQAIRARVQYGTVSGVVNRMGFVDNSMAEDTDMYEFFQYGTLQWLTGANAGVVTEIRDFQIFKPGYPTFQLIDVMMAPIQPGDTYWVAQGCNHIRSTCSMVFNNVWNFRGFPDMPTEDTVLATPNFENANASFNL